MCVCVCVEACPIFEMASPFMHRAISARGSNNDSFGILFERFVQGFYRIPWNAYYSNTSVTTETSLDAYFIFFLSNFRNENNLPSAFEFD